MARTGVAVLVTLGAAVLGASRIFKGEAPVTAKTSLMDVPSHVLVNSAPALIVASEAAGALVRQDYIYGQVAGPAVAASETYSDPALPAWLGDINIKTARAAKEWYAGKTSSSQGWVSSVVGPQLPSKQLAVTVSEVKGDVHNRTRSRSRPAKDPVGGSPVKRPQFQLKSSQVATQSLAALLGAVVTDSDVGGVLFLLAGAGVGAAAVSTEKDDKGADKKPSATLLKRFLLAPLFLALLMEVFHRNGGAVLFLLAETEEFRRQAYRLVRFGLVLF